MPVINPKKISAIISTRNGEKFIAGCLDNLLRQTVAHDIEIIIINSASEQNEESIIYGYMKKNKNIKYLKTPKIETLYAAWNRALKMASGMYIVSANVDDRSSLDAFEIMTKTLDAKREIALVYSDYYITAIPNETIGFIRKVRRHWKACLKPDYSHQKLLLDCLCGRRPMWRRSLHDALGYFDESYLVSGDYEFWLRIAERYQMFHIKKFLCVSYIGKECLSRKYQNIALVENTRLRRKILGIERMPGYAGSKFYCPCCQGSFDKMLPYRKIYFLRGKPIHHATENAICPVCHSDIRHRFLIAFINQQKLISAKPLKLLHFAPEKCVGDFLKGTLTVDYTACDINPLHIGIERVDITDITYPDQSFDAVIITHVLEHVQNDRRALKEVYRILKPGGWSIISVPIYGKKTLEAASMDKRQRERIAGIADHVRLYGIDIKDKLRNAGFSVTVLSLGSVKGNYVDRRVKSAHLASDKYLFYCKK